MDKSSLLTLINKYIEENYTGDILMSPCAESFDLACENRIATDMFRPRRLVKESKRGPLLGKRCESGAAVNRRSIDDVLDHVNDSFQETLFYLIDTKGLNDVDVYGKAHIDRRLFSKIRSNKDFKPSKKTAICLCFGLELSLDESVDLLGRAGYTLSHSSKSDLIVEYFLKTGETDLDVLNEILYDYGLDLLYV